MKSLVKWYYRQILLHENNKQHCTAEGYFHSCRFPYASQCVLELQVSPVATNTGTAIVAELKTFAKHLKKTHMYKQQAKYHLLIKSPVHVLQCTLLWTARDIPVTVNSACLMNTINNILNGVQRYYVLYHCYVIVRIQVLTCDTRASTP